LIFLKNIFCLLSIRLKQQGTFYARGVVIKNEKNQNIAVQVERLNHIIFLYVDDNLSADKHNWLRRKANVTKHFEESSLSIKYDLVNGNMNLAKTFALDEKEYLAKGGSIPIFVKNAGMIAVVTVSGLHDKEDHEIIIDALRGKFINSEHTLKWKMA